MHSEPTNPAGNIESQAAPKRKRYWRRLLSVWAVSHVLGLVSSYHALMETRTSQGAVAWMISLNTMPVVSVPAYWVFGRSKFQGYVAIRREIHEKFQEQAERVNADLAPFVRHPESTGNGALVGSQLAEMPYVGGNAVELLVDGTSTFDSIMEGIASAEEYVLFQFYIVRADGLGTRLQEALIERANAGVDVWFLYDEIGSKGLPKAYGEKLRAAGVKFQAFHSTRGSGNRFQLNFRNHRKIVVVDGGKGWVGGHNVGDEYLGSDSEIWRDTHLRIDGPAALQLQLSFLEDWRWATDELLVLPWDPQPAGDSDSTALILPTGPADELESASLMIQQAIHSAHERIWIASPYFVPDQAVMSALHLATLRGVDVRILIPDEPDSKLVAYSVYAFAGQLLRSGVRILKYEPGFMHQKVFLVDKELVGIGTVNLDNRSFRLNFEVTALVADRDLAEDVRVMLEADFSNSREMTISDVDDKSTWFRILSRASFLTAPVQ